MSGEQARSPNAAKTSDEAGATPAFDARCVTAFHGVASASLTVKIKPLDGEEFVCTGSRDGFPVKKVRFSFCTSEIATSSPCRKRISRESKNLGENAKTKIASGKTKNWAGATPLFRLPAAQKVFGVAPAHYACHTQLVASAQSLPNKSHARFTNAGMQEGETKCQF
jgi:hypothetical protein